MLHYMFGMQDQGLGWGGGKGGRGVSLPETQQINVSPCCFVYVWTRLEPVITGGKNCSAGF